MTSPFTLPPTTAEFVRQLGAHIGQRLRFSGHAPLARSRPPASQVVNIFGDPVRLLRVCRSTPGILAASVMLRERVTDGRRLAAELDCARHSGGRARPF